MKPAMKLTTSLLILCLATAAAANPFPGGNAEKGQKLFEQHNCNSCHNSMMGGDGNKIFTRFNRIVSTTEGLLGQIDICSGNVNAQLSAQDKQDLGAYLNRYYNLK